MFNQINFPNMFKALVQALQPASYSNGAPRARVNDEKYKYSDDRGATRPGAIHKVNATFHSRQIMPISPAQYRHLHMGKQKKV